MLAWPIRSWWSFALRGILGVLFGAGAIAWPTPTISGLVLAFAIYLIVDGVLALSVVIEHRGLGGPWSLPTVEDALSVLVGIAVLAAPDRGAVALWTVLAVWAAVTGALALSTGLFTPRGLGGGLITTSGIVDLLLGLFLVLRPATTGLALAWLLGSYTIIVGVLYLTLALHLRHTGGPFITRRSFSGS